MDLSSNLGAGRAIAFDHTASMSWKALDWATDIRVGSPWVRLSRCHASMERG
jgi:hypothetical protein